MKPFYKSRKLAYAIGGLLAALVIALLPEVTSLDPESESMLRDILPLVFVVIALLITGHSATDIAAIWREGVQYRDLPAALHDLIDALAEGDDPIAIEFGDPVEGEIDETMRPHIPPAAADAPEVE